MGLGGVLGPPGGWGGGGTHLWAARSEQLRRHWGRRGRECGPRSGPPGLHNTHVAHRGHEPVRTVPGCGGRGRWTTRPHFLGSKSRTDPMTPFATPTPPAPQPPPPPPPQPKPVTCTRQFTASLQPHSPLPSLPPTPLHKACPHRVDKQPTTQARRTASPSYGRTNKVAGCDTVVTSGGHGHTAGAGGEGAGYDIVGNHARARRHLRNVCKGGAQLVTENDLAAQL